MVAKIGSVSNDVRWKSAMAISWQPLRNNFALQSGDSVFCGNNSGLAIKFPNKNEIHLRSETLLVIDGVKARKGRSDLQVDLTVSYGNIEVQSEVPTHWNIASHETHLELRGSKSQSQIRIGKDRTLSVNQKRGITDLRMNGNQKILQAGAEVRLNTPGSVPDPPILPLELPIASEVSPVEPEVEPSSIEEKAPPKIVEIKKVSPSLLQGVQKVKPIPSSAPVAKSPYSPPTLKAPFDESKVFLYRGNPLKIQFSWVPDKNIKIHHLQISLSDQFDPITIEKNIPASRLDVELPRTGKYYWRVRGIDVNGLSSEWSKSNYFILEYN